MNRLEEKLDFDEGLEDGLTESMQEELGINGYTDLTAESDGEEEDGLEQLAYSSSDDSEEAEDDDEQDNDDDADNSADENFVEQHDEEEQHDEDDDIDDKVPPSKKAKTANGAVAKKPTKGAVVQKGIKAGSPPTLSDMKKQQASLKRDRTEELKDEEKKAEVKETLKHYLFVATMQVAGGQPQFRQEVLAEADTGGPRVAQLAQAVTEIEALINKSVLLANAATPGPMQEITDFVKGASVIETGPESYAKAATRCEIMKTSHTGANELVCLKALHHVRRAGGVVEDVWKRKVVRATLRPLIDAFLFVLNMLLITENIIADKLLTSSKYKNNQSTLADAIRIICDDTTQKSPINTVYAKLKAALDRVDMSATMLAK